MSKTDKTDPYWVQLRDPDFKWGVRAHHYHHLRGWDGVCRIVWPTPPTRRPGWRLRMTQGNIDCEFWPRYMDNDKVYGRSRWRRRWGSFQDHRVRADLRRLKARWLKETDREEIDSTENMPTSRWRWRRWYWD